MTRPDTIVFEHPLDTTKRDDEDRKPPEPGRAGQGNIGSFKAMPQLGGV
jgi:hypothetical protein